MAVDYFLKLDGVDGEATDDKHKGEIDVLSFSWGAMQSGTHGRGGGGGEGKVNINDLSFTMNTNKASTKLFLFCANGTHISKGTLVCRKAGKDQQEFLTIKLTDILISGYQSGGSTGAVIPIEQVSLNFAKIDVEYKEQKKDGTLGPKNSAGWDLMANKQT